ncbi:hypothetical protein [Crocosphaera sp. Alani8]|uniref:hypothetical protein n=1 Tax=Crocosphaera sp. Alani8 TaxID=3038952 RepID=UPI00313E934F
MLTITHLFIKTNYALAEKSEGSIIEDDLNIQNLLPWGLPDLPYSQVLDIQDSLINSSIGKVVIDKYEDTNGGLIVFTNPPHPGKQNFISLWGSKIEGCFVRLIFQYASSSNPIDHQKLTPIRLDIGVDGTIIRLRREGIANAQYWKQNYTYKVSNNQISYNRTGVLYVGKQSFPINSEQVNHLRSSSPQEVKGRITFSDGSTIIFPIGVETVKRWKNVYSFNPSCKPIN